MLETAYPVTYLIIGVTIVTSVFAFMNHAFMEDLLFSTERILKNKEIYRVITSMFLHADWGHLLFNMFSFYSFAELLEYQYGGYTVLIIYLVSGVFADLFTLIIKRNDLSYRALGASGAVLGIIFASIFLAPGGSIYLFFIPVPIPDYLYAVLYIALSIYFMRKNNDGIGHAAHLGGAICGIILAFIFNSELVLENKALLLGISGILAASIALFKFKPNLFS
ncbi:MAG: rhomboid family intramembrane serine protease [Spirochaetia bacterium]|nr:rhomboid family intramembrane serine protease [Spirochaetia bacterium]